MLATLVPNRAWQYGSGYITMDRVYIPSTTELGDIEHDWPYHVSTASPQFSMATDLDRCILLGRSGMHYWLRSPFLDYGYSVRDVSSSGELYYFGFQFNYAYYGGNGVLPALNLKADTKFAKNIFVQLYFGENAFIAGIHCTHKYY